MLRNFTPELGINIVCLLITAAAPTIAIGPLVGLPLGLACSFGLLAAMKYQRGGDARVRNAALWAVWVIRFFALTLEQMAYQDAFEGRKSLPFGLDAMWWGWIAPAVMGALDIMAYYITAARAAAVSSAADHAANLARADELNRAQHERKAAEEAAKREQELALARITAETEKAKALALANAQTEATKAQAAAQAEAAKAKAEAAKAQAEADRKRAELEAERTRSQEEARRKQEEEARKRAEDQAEARRKEQAGRRKQEEEARKQQEAERKDKAAQEAAIKARIARWRDAQSDEKALMIEEAAQEVLAKTGKKATQAELAAIIGVTDKTIRTFLNSPQMEMTR